MFTDKISQEKVDEIRLALETSTGYKSSLTNLELKAIIYYGNKIAERGLKNECKTSFRNPGNPNRMQNSRGFSHCVRRYLQGK